MDKTKLFIGNLNWAVTDDQLRDLFSQAGTVTDAVVIKDRMNNRSKGFGFVQMSTEEEANKAVEMFNGQELDGRELVVNIARPKA